MYSVTITNSTGAPMTTNDGQTIKPDGTWKSDTLGNAWVHSEEFGSMSFRDIGSDHIGGDTDETWGVLITYAGQHAVGRYEGGGQLEVAFDKYLRAHISGMNLRHVALRDMVFKGETDAASGG
ncbi:MAG: hypothetical protein M3340_12175 [Actinomycetota bacterium]|nr:hypothetical protein [Actinomycetota bacterium]